MQGQGKPGEEKRYSNSVDCYRKIYKFEGVTGYWTGWLPNVARNSVITAAELASYGQIKQLLLKYTPLRDNIFTHLFSGFVSFFNI